MNVLDSFSLKGKVALVTGGSGIYGHCITKAFAEAGTTTYLASRNLENCKELAKKLCVKGYDVKAARLDLANEDSINKLIDFFLSKNSKTQFIVFSTKRSNAINKLNLPDSTIYLTADNGYSDALSSIWLMSQAFHHIITHSTFIGGVLGLACKIMVEPRQVKKFSHQKGFLNADAIVKTG